MFINTSGDVGIGTTNPTAKLEVAGSVRSLRTGSTAAVLQVINDNNSWNISCGTTTQVFAVDNNLVGRSFYVNPNNNFVVNQNIGIGNTTPTTSGTGITFPATQSASSDANTLDDYEEGTFTPSLFAGGANMVSAYNSDRQGIYTKIGNTVFWIARISDITKNAQSGGVTLEGLPFTTNATYFGNTSNWNYSGITTTGSFIVRTNLATTNCVFQTTDINGVGSPIQASGINGPNMNFILSGFYRVA